MASELRRRNTLGHWDGRAFLSLGRALYLGAAGDTTPHAHHAIQVSIGLDAPLRLRHAGAAWQEYDGAIVAPDTPHQLDGGWGSLALFYVEPDSVAGSQRLQPRDGEICEIASEDVAAVRATAGMLARHPDNAENARSVYRSLLASLHNSNRISERPRIRGWRRR